MRGRDAPSDAAAPARDASDEAIIAASENGDAQGAADAVRENWLSLGALIEKTFRSEET